jgi:TIR domain
MAAASAASFRKFRIFVSYSTRDDAFAQQLVAHLECEEICCFFAPRDIPAREDWQSRLRSEIRGSDIVLFLYSPESATSEYVLFEISEAAGCGKPVWLVKERNSRLDLSFARFRFTDREAFTFHLGREIECFDLLKTALQQEWEKLNRGVIDPTDCPYPGFKPFGKAFADYYFGRLEDARALAEALNSPHDSGDGTKDDRLLFMYGPSGVGKTSLLTVGVRKMLAKENWLSVPILIPDHVRSGNTGYSLMRAVLSQLREGVSLSPATGQFRLAKDDDVVSQIAAAAARKAEETGSIRFVVIFDQVEDLFIREEDTGGGQFAESPGTQFLNYVNNLLKRCWRDRIDVRIIVSFREEYWGRVELYTEQLQIKPWWRPIRKLLVAQAVECIVQPAKVRRVEFDRELAEALAAALAVREGRDYTVEPRKISQVCKYLWEKVGRMPGGPHSEINAGSLAEWSGSVQERAKGFVREVLEKDLDEALRQIAQQQDMLVGATTTDPTAKEEFIRLSLLEFVANHKRTRVPENFQNGVRCIGRLPGKVADEFISRGLVRKCGEAPEYELVHDFLAEAIDQRYRGKVAFELSFHQLASTLRNVKDQEIFNRETTLLADLEPALENKLYFREDEAEFLLRCALGSDRSSARGKTISLTGWAETLGAASPQKLAEVLRSALIQNYDYSVTLDALGLLHNAEIRRRIGSALELYNQVIRLALEGETAVRKRACAALIAADEGRWLEVLFSCLNDSQRRRAAREAIGLLREAVDTLRGTGEQYWPRWYKLGLLPRARILGNLLALRMRESFGRCAYVIAVSAGFTAIGAAIPFVLVGNFGASLTMGEPNAPAGLLQGSAGGFVWGAAVSLLLLLYTVIWRGGRTRKTARDSVGIFAAGLLGGVIGGICNSAMIASTFDPVILQKAGWIYPCRRQPCPELRTTLPRLVEAIQTGYGWALPILGIALGAAVAWSLIIILGDSGEKWAGEQKPIEHPAEAWRCIKTISSKAFPNAWRNLVVIALGALAARWALQPWVEIDANLPGAWWRTAGIALVVLFGSLFCEVGFLFGVLCVRVGTSMGEYREFLRPGSVTGSPSA